MSEQLELLFTHSTQETGARNVPNCLFLHYGIGCLFVILTFFAMRPPQLADLHIHLQIDGINISDEDENKWSKSKRLFFQPMSPYIARL